MRYTTTTLLPLEETNKVKTVIEMTEQLSNRSIKFDREYDSVTITVGYTDRNITRRVMVTFIRSTVTNEINTVSHDIEGTIGGSTKEVSRKTFGEIVRMMK